MNEFVETFALKPIDVAAGEVFVVPAAGACMLMTAIGSPTIPCDASAEPTGFPPFWPTVGLLPVAPAGPPGFSWLVDPLSDAVPRSADTLCSGLPLHPPSAYPTAAARARRITRSFCSYIERK